MGRRLLAIAASFALVIAACGDDDVDVVEVPVEENGDDDAEAWRSCENASDGYTIEYPGDWRTNDGDVMEPCSLFDPEPIDAAEDTEIPLDLAVIITVDPVDFDDASAPDPFQDELDRETATVDDRSAVRLEVVGTGEGFLPEGVEATRWLVDLQGRTLSAATYDVGDPPYDESQRVLDDMIGTLDLDVDPTAPGPEPAPEPEGPDPVGDPGVDEVASEDFPGGFGDTAFLTDLRASPQEAGFDRVVLEFEGDAVPSYRVTYVDPPIVEDASGHEVEIAGTAFLELRLEPAAGVDLTDEGAEETYTGPDRISVDGAHVVTEVVRIGDFEANLAWVVGLDQQVPFGVEFLEDPLRLVVDLVS